MSPFCWGILLIASIYGNAISPATVQVDDAGKLKLSGARDVTLVLLKKVVKAVKLRKTVRAIAFESVDMESDTRWYDDCNVKTQKYGDNIYDGKHGQNDNTRMKTQNYDRENAILYRTIAVLLYISQFCFLRTTPVLAPNVWAPKLTPVPVK